MSNIKIGIQTRSLRQPLKQALHMAARLGADGVEIDARNELKPSELSQTGKRQFQKLLSDLNLRVAAVAFPTRRGYDDPAELERRVMATHAAMKFAGELGADVLINRVGRVPENTEEPAFSRFVEALTAIGAYGDRVGARLAAQTADESPANLRRLIEALPEHTIGIDLHPGELILAGHSPHEALEVLGPHVIHVHASDAVRDFGSGRARQVEIGRGTADLPELLGRLTEFDYRGWVTIDARDTPEANDEIENAIAFLRAL